MDRAPDRRGTGSYDGGCHFTGELLLVHLDTGEAVSALEHPREVVRAEWRSATALSLAVAPADDWEDPLAHGRAHPAVIERADWSAVGHQGVSAVELAAPAEEFDRADPGADASWLLLGLAGSAGREWSPRTRVRAVEALPDGRVLAALDGVLAEAWLPSGERQWAVEDEEGGRELLLAPDAASVWANAERPRRPHRTAHPAPRVARLSADDGRVLENLPVEDAVTLLSGGGRTLRRPLEGYRGTRQLTVLGPDGLAQGPAVTGFDPLNHAFPVRHASAPYLLVGADPHKPHADKWIATVDADGTLRRICPHSPEPGEHHFGGPAAETGGVLVYAGTVFPEDGSYVVRRSLADGAVRWRFRSEVPATALDTDGEVVHVAGADGTLLALDASDGSVRWRTRLRVHGAATVALSLAAAPGGGLLAGTADGRILHLADRPRP